MTKLTAQEYNAQYRETHKEYFREYFQKYHQNNKETHQKTMKAWQQQHREHIQQYQRKRKQIAKQWVCDYKLSHPCEVCGEADPRCLDFHHNNGEKELNISQMVSRGYSPQKINEEIIKCCVLCSNCHRRKQPVDRVIR